jgi:hypothetical protein
VCDGWENKTTALTRYPSTTTAVICLIYRFLGIASTWLPLTSSLLLFADARLSPHLPTDTPLETQHSTTTTIANQTS